MLPVCYSPVVVEHVEAHVGDAVAPDATSREAVGPGIVQLNFCVSKELQCAAEQGVGQQYVTPRACCGVLTLCC